MAAVAGEVLGPRPGLAIVSFSQGIIEVLLRVVATVVGAVPVLIAGAISLSNDVLSVSIPSPDQPAVIDDSIGAAGYAVGIAGMAILIELLMIFLRFLNIGIINIKINIFLFADIAFSVLFAIGFLAAGIVLAIFSKDWDDLLNVSLGSFESDVENIRNSMAAGAAFGFVSLILFAILAVWMIMFMVKEWNTKVVKYTLKEAVAG